CRGVWGRIPQFLVFRDINQKSPNSTVLSPKGFKALESSVFLIYGFESENRRGEKLIIDN
ncbi:hypothetical protein, partial [Plectonema radiosum]|uniref:hypothetical protein n=1 Tax=Plectonema radiosum TaxID=945768 RepID=UPI001D144B38